MVFSQQVIRFDQQCEEGFSKPYASPGNLKMTLFYKDYIYQAATARPAVARMVHQPLASCTMPVCDHL
jgi:hypothetical protein